MTVRNLLCGLGLCLALTLAGTNAIHGGMILVTPNMADTPVVIKGGTLVRQGCGGAADITIANFNTNATLTLDCDILGDVVATDGSVKTNASASAGASWRCLRPARGGGDVYRERWFLLQSL